MESPINTARLSQRIFFADTMAGNLRSSEGLLYQ